MKSLIVILSLIITTAAAQVSTPPIRINQQFTTSTEVALCNDDSVMYFSKYSFLDNTCVQQHIFFLDVEMSWANNFITDNMEFIKTDTAFVKSIPSGFLVAKTKPALVDYHGMNDAIEMVITLYEWIEEEL